ncbi:MAG: HEAT repeat domain-containing protein [Polyangiaceae bacterium]|nr:HEAT repeat domain-containing protein [Polyangiaceae bacterium]
MLLPLILAAQGAAAAEVVWPSELERLAHGLRAADISERREASRKLITLPSGVSRELVISALKDADSEVRLRAAQAASRTAMSGTGTIVLGWLSDPNEEARLAALAVLKLDPVSASAGTLGRSLSDAVPRVRIRAAEALGALASPDAARSLLGHLEDQDKQVRLTVYRELGLLGDKASALSLLGKASDPDAEIRVVVLNSLGKLKEPRSLTTLLTALKDRDESVRQAALGALGALGEPQAVPAIDSLLQSQPRAAEQRAALLALAAIGGDAAIAVNLKVLTSTHPMAATVFADSSLVRMGQRAVPSLRECVTSRKELEIADRCLGVWSKLEPKSAALAGAEALKSGATSRLAAVRAIGLGGQASLLPGVLAELVSEDPSLRVAAREASALILSSNRGQTMAVDPIVEALVRYRADSTVLLEHLKLLGLTGATRAGAQLLPFSREGNPAAVRLAAIEAFGDLSPGAYDRVLLALLSDEDPRVAGAAALALRRMGRGELLPSLIAELGRATDTNVETLAVSLLGPLSRNKDEAVGEQAFAKMLYAEGRERDLWLEALGRSPLQPWLPRLKDKLATFGGADRRKVAEAFAGVNAALPLLQSLARDPDGSVRASAVWSLGTLSLAENLQLLRAATRDRDVTVAINATGALARFALIHAGAERQTLCSLLAHSHPYVRMNALAGLQTSVPMLKADSCSAEVQRLKLEELSEGVRGVADAVIDPRQLPSAVRGPLTVLVVPVGRSQPEPEAAFALRLPGGLVHTGVADRRGGVFEVDAPLGDVALLVPAHLAW